MVILAVAAVFFFGYRPGPQLYSELEAVQDIDILATSESPEFFAELDFFGWLADEMKDAG